MDHIETKILNSYTIQETAQNMVFAASLTHQSHTIQNMDDLMELYQKSFTDKTVNRISILLHPTVQKFTVITVAIVGANRRFLAQITRHQNEVKFMSASLQYSNYSKKLHLRFHINSFFSNRNTLISIWKAACRILDAIKNYVLWNSHPKRMNSIRNNESRLSSTRRTEGNCL